MTTLRAFAICVAGVVASAPQSVGAKQSTANRSNARPNIVLIMSDNQTSRLIGAYGNEDIKTPNIDALARAGVLFRNAFAASGVCSPTRASLLTGLMPSQTGVHVALPGQPAMDSWSAIEEFRNLPQALAEVGYTTALIGKYHLGRHELPQLGFSYWVTFPAGHTTTFYDQEVIDNGEIYKVNKHLTDFWTDKAEAFIGRQGAEQPFFLLLSYNGPYMLPPTVLMEPNNRHASQYTQNPPSMPHDPVHPYLEAWARGRGPSSEMVDEGTTAWRAINALNNPIAMINTASETTMVDDGVGRVVSQLQRNGLSDNTLVIYTSDQGARYGHHGLWGNTSWSFPFVVHGPNMEVPLILSHPGKLSEGQVLDEFINQVDIFPTLLNYVGIDSKIENSAGKDFNPLMTGVPAEWEDLAYFEFVTVRVIRTKRWKYSKHFRSAGESTLFDLVDDPQERVNLIDDPQYAKVLINLDQKLSAYFATYSDPEYDLWAGGTAKAILLDKHYGRNDIFREQFPNWREPFLRKAKPFDHAEVRRAH